MKTVVKSPKQLLREHFAALRGTATEPLRGRRVGDWSEFHCGDLVYDKADKRHIGRIKAIQNSAVATVVWDETGWISEVPLSDLRAAPLPDVQTLLRNRAKKGKANER